MPKLMTVSFLGTSSGGGPTEKRACSSLALDLSGGEELWMVDMAEGTMRQFYHQKIGLKPGKVKKIFVTHLHMDHCIGVPGFLANILRGKLQGQAGSTANMKPYKPKIEIYGPAGLRALVRTVLSMTSCVLSESYTVHELLTQEELSTSCSPNQLHDGEVKGRDILPDDDGFWRDICRSRFAKVDACPIEHRAPCLGYVFTTHDNSSLTHISRKVVILGDTCDPSRIAPLTLDADLLIHEATDASIPSTVDPKSKEHKRTPAFVEAQARERGHSTPGMAGGFAKSIRAKRLVLNHIGARFPPADAWSSRNTRSIREIERQAMEASDLPSSAVQAAYDFLVVPIGEEQTEANQNSTVVRTNRSHHTIESSSYQRRHWKHTRY